MYTHVILLISASGLTVKGCLLWVIKWTEKVGFCMRGTGRSSECSWWVYLGFRWEWREFIHQRCFGIFVLPISLYVPFCLFLCISCAFNPL